MMIVFCVASMVCAQAATVHLDGSRDDVVVLAGRSAAEVKDAIVLPANACESHREAARELRKYLAQITGRGPAMKVFLERGPDELGADGFRLQVRDGALHISGGERGVLYGAWDVLERFGGCGWFSANTEVVPKKDAVELPAGLDETHKPAFLMRSTSWRTSADPRRLSARLRLNGYTRPRLPEKFGGEAYPFVKGAGICHTFVTLLPSKVWFESHPEYFCERDGRRRSGDETQPCLTNPDVLRIVTSNVLERLAKEPDAKMVGISQNDNQMYCQCATCAAVDEAEGSHAGTLVRFVNAVAEAVEKVRPDVLVQTLIYQYTRKPPKLTKLRHNVTPCLCSIECRRNVPLDDPSVVANARFMDDLRAWAGISDHLYIWDYTTNYRNYLYPTPLEGVFQPNLKIFRNNKVKYMFEEGTSAHADFAALKTYLLAKWMWDPDLDEKALTDRFFAGYYGAAAPFVRAYYDRCRAEQAKNRRQDIGIFNAAPPKWYDSAFATWARARFAAAKAAVKDDPVRLWNVKLSELVPTVVELDRHAENAKCFFVTRQPERFPGRTDLDADYAEVMATVAEAKRRKEDVRFAAGLCWEPCKLALWKTVYGGTDRTAKDRLVIRPTDLFIVSGRHAKTMEDGIHFLPSSGAAMAKLFFRNVAFDADAEYEVRFRLKVTKGGKPGAAFRAALGPEGAKAITNLGEGTNAENSLEVIEKRTDEVGEDWTWYAFKPVRLREKFALEVGSGPWEHGGGIGATKEVVLDRVEIVRTGADFVGIELVSPKEGETVEQLWPDVKAFLDMPREAREENQYRISEAERKSFRQHAGAKPVEFRWTGDAKGVYSFKVEREPDGKVFVERAVTGCTTQVKGRLEIARGWKWTVSDGSSSASGRFRTEDRAPRIVSLEGVSNARDFGGWIGLDGRRVKQGMALRTGGLNNNAKNEYYTYEEILELFKQGRLEGAGEGKNAAWLSREYAAKLGRGNGIDRNFLQLIKSAPKGPGTERLTPADRDYLLNFWKIRSDLDLRGDWETFGMLFSPLGKDVDWHHYETRSAYGGFITPVGRAAQALNLSVFLDKRAYPIDFHCIGGTDRTGTLAYLLNGFLGVCEEDLIRDYEMSFIGSGGVDRRHYGWLRTLVKCVRELPGETIADKIRGYYLSLGYTAEQLTELRERLLEPKK